MSLNIKEQLELARKEDIRTKAKATLHRKWMEKFKESGDDLEHAAFLSLWLSMYVFLLKSVNSGTINKHLFPVPALLSRGIKLALGPVVLANLYRDLSDLSKRPRFTQVVDHSHDNIRQTNICALFHLVLIWAWERFPILQPILDCTSSVPSTPRLARWSNVEILNDKDLSSVLDSAEEAFLWRPYGNGSPFGQCVETVELVGFDSCIEKYQPKQVARQFELDQDTHSEDTVDCVSPGFAPRIEVIHVIDSDSDDDCDVPMTKLLNLPILATGLRTPFSSSIAYPDEELCKTKESESVSVQIKMEDCEEDGITNKDQLEPLQYSNLVSPNEEVVEDAFFVNNTNASERVSVQIKEKDYEEDDITNNDQLAELQHSNLVSPDVEVEEIAVFVDNTNASERVSVQIKFEDYKEDGITKKDQSAQLQHPNSVFPPLENELMKQWTV